MTISETGQAVASGTPHFHGETALAEASAQSRTVSVSGSSQAVKCSPGASVLDAFERALRPVSVDGEAVVRVGCRRGGCGICKVRVLAGLYRTTPMSRAHVSEEEQSDGLVLSCCVFPETDLVIASVPVCPRSLKKN
ncbi:MAG TPA: 2Fe-2S iron-sulfur cluster binding domain-containing protein [Candidatus Sulfotelmatobacter sp.]|nr:2Fe-2S iron-sulfur cluster binding domain-containing protein [Candidatus Sulfotelmatobacter sp.]